METLHSSAAAAGAPLDDASVCALSVVIPAYQEGMRIAHTLGEIVAYLEGRGEVWEIVVVDDGSRDDTAAIVRAFAEARGGVRLLRLAENRGKGAALRTGVAATRGRRVLITDADLSSPIGEIVKLERALDAGYSGAFGSRAAGGADVRARQPLARVLLGRAGNLWIRLLAAPGFSDTQCGFKLFDGPTARRLFALCREERFALDIELICVARRVVAAPIAEVGVTWVHREGSKVRPRDYLETIVAVPRIALSARRLARSPGATLTRRERPRDFAEAPQAPVASV